MKQLWSIISLALVFVSANSFAQTNFQKSNFSDSQKMAVKAKVLAPDGRASILYGDVDGDGTLTVNDVRDLSKSLIDSEYKLVNHAASDMNQDGVVTIADVTCLIEELLHPSKGLCNGYEYVDLGLSVKWATCNIGADVPEQYGSFYAWGETEEKDTYLWETYQHNTKGNSYWEGCKKYQVADGQTRGIWYDGNTFVGDGIETLESCDDVATQKWGDGWRLPTKEEFEELLTQCTWKWVSNGYKKGYEISRMGRSIFIPTAGCEFGDSYYGTGSYGYYWTSCLTSFYTNCAYSLYINRNEKEIGYDERCYGLTVRPVCP